MHTSFPEARTPWLPLLETHSNHEINSSEFVATKPRRRMMIKSVNARCALLSRCLSSSGSSVLKVGDTLSQSRAFTSDDVLGYSKASHDSNPLHFDSGFARNSGFEDCLAHGMLVASIFPSIIASHFPGAVYISQSLNFKLPVYIGEEIIGRVEAVHLRENKKRYLAKFSTRCFKNGGDLLVLDGEATAILPTLALRHHTTKFD